MQHPITRAARRYQRQRVIAKRVRIVRWAWQLEGNRWYVPGRFARYNLCCSCWMCREEKYRDTRAKNKVMR